MAEKLTDAQRRIMGNIRDYDDPTRGLVGMAAMGGFNQTSAALFRKGLVEWVDRKMVLTDEGVKAITTNTPL